jgi:hypothetical protein
VVSLKDGHEVTLFDVRLFGWEPPQVHLKLGDGTEVDIPFGRIDRISVMEKNGQYSRHVKVLLLKGKELEGSASDIVGDGVEGDDSDGLVRKVHLDLIATISMRHK